MIKTLPQPIVEWTTVLESSEPLKDATRARYRTLLKHGVASQGLTVAVREKGRLAGKRTFHSVLAALAIRAEKAGDTTGAAYLSDEASRLEGRYASVLSDFLARHTAEDLPDADFYARLVKDTSDALQRWGRLPDLVFASGLLAEIDPDSAHIEAVTRDGTPIDLLLPRLLTEERGITLGDPVLVFRRFVGHAAVVDVLPALTVKQTESGEIEMSWPDADADATESQPTDAQVAKRDDEGPAARRYMNGPGAPPSKTELEALIDIASTRPPRKIRVVVG